VIKHLSTRFKYCFGWRDRLPPRGFGGNTSTLTVSGTCTIASKSELVLPSGGKELVQHVRMSGKSGFPVRFSTKQPIRALQE
jgi:hypothetical protein